jgi:hypothetical protein
METRHLNDDSTDNRWPENLVWGTHPENCEDRDRNGGACTGEDVGGSKLTEEIVRGIRLQFLPGRKMPQGSLRMLTEELGVSEECIRKLRNRITWSHIS